MSVLIISGTPKSEGLCFSCIEAACEGVIKADTDYELISLCDENLSSCKVCGEGWGVCRSENMCQYGSDGFTEIQQKIKNSDAIIIVTPVYWGEMTEVMKSFFDRFRRCEAIKGNNGAIVDKPVLLIASPGGSGNGALSCLEQMERLCHHLHAKIYDYIIVNRWNRDYKLAAICSAATYMTNSIKDK